MILYLDTSAAAKLIVREEETSALQRHLAAVDRAGGSVRSSALLETELRRAASRIGVAQTAVSVLLSSIDLADLSRDVFGEAGLLGGPSLRSLDALHIVMSLRMGADEFVSYDVRQIEAARSLGVHVVSPGAAGA